MESQECVPEVGRGDGAIFLEVLRGVDFAPK